MPNRESTVLKRKVKTAPTTRDWDAPSGFTGAITVLPAGYKRSAESVPLKDRLE